MEKERKKAWEEDIRFDFVNYSLHNMSTFKSVLSYF